MRYVRLDTQNTVVEAVTEVEYNTFNATVQAMFMEAPQHVERNWKLEDGTWIEPEPIPEPTPVKEPISRHQFRSRFTLQEKAAIYEAAKTDVMIQVFLDDVMAADQVDLELPDVIEGVEYLEQQELIETGRAAEILGT